MIAIFRRELSSYFYSPVAYIFLTAFYLIAGAFFFIFNLISSSADMTALFSMLLLVVLLLQPLITMRLFTDEKRQKTDQLLLTSPVSLFKIVLGKFFAAFAVFTMALSVVLVYAVILAAFTSPGWALVAGSFVGLLFVGASVIAIGLFVSSLTESQVVAAIGTYACVIVVFLVDVVAGLIKWSFLRDFVYGFSFVVRFDEMAYGIFRPESIVFFASLIAVFLFLTVRVFEKKRWN